MLQHQQQAAATQLTQLVVSGELGNDRFASLVGQVHKLVGLRSLWIDVNGMNRFDVDAAAASLTQLTELSLPPSEDCEPPYKFDPALLGRKFPGATLGRTISGARRWYLSTPCDTGTWRVQRWSRVDGNWEYYEWPED